MGTAQYSAPICTDMYILLQERVYRARYSHNGGSVTPVTETACMHIYSFIQEGVAVPCLTNVDTPRKKNCAVPYLFQKFACLLESMHPHTHTHTQTHTDTHTHT
jgi:hypothetical protein